jgi:hypothetical protein
MAVIGKFLRDALILGFQFSSIQHFRIAFTPTGA